MTDLGHPLQIFAASSAILWPLAAGATLVLWTKARAAQRRRRLAAIDGDLQGLFRTVEAQPVPERLELVVEALAEGEALSPKPARRRARRKAEPAA
ncbi:MAG: hypothetical protein KGO51_01490 [Alphaproteobacteria bacterium]|nr:hypothetical protein [Alphaproteobacteria bacterium]